MQPKEVFLSALNGHQIEGIVPEVIGPISSKSCDYANCVIQFYHNSEISREVINRRKSLIPIIQDFHKRAGTYTPTIKKELAKLKDKNTLILNVGHQPNLFPYLGVIAQFILMRAISNLIYESANIPVVELFTINDYDFIDEKWFRHTNLPCIDCKDPNESGSLKLSIPVPSPYRKRVMTSLPKVDIYIVRRWESQIKNWISSNLKYVCRTSL